MVSPILDKNKVEIANVMAFHMNMNTDAVNMLHKKLDGVQPKAVIGWQCRRTSWPQNYWSSVVLFHDDNIAFPTFTGDWEFRHVYVDV